MPNNVQAGKSTKHKSMDCLKSCARKQLKGGGSNFYYFTWYDSESKLAMIFIDSSCLHLPRFFPPISTLTHLLIWGSLQTDFQSNKPYENMYIYTQLSPELRNLNHHQCQHAIIQWALSS